MQIDLHAFYKNFGVFCGVSRRLIYYTTYVINILKQSICLFPLISLQNLLKQYHIFCVPSFNNTKTPYIKPLSFYSNSSALYQCSYASFTSSFVFSTQFHNPISLLTETKVRQDNRVPGVRISVIYRQMWGRFTR